MLGLKGPGCSMDMVVSQTDILPTILDAVGACTGRDRWSQSIPSVLGDESPVYSMLSEVSPSWRTAFSVRSPAISIFATAERSGAAPRTGPDGRGHAGLPLQPRHRSRSAGSAWSRAWSRRSLETSFAAGALRAAHGRVGERKTLSPAFIEEPSAPAMTSRRAL